MSKAGNKLDPSFWLSLFFVGVIAVWVVTAARWEWDTRLFPWAIGIPALALAVCQLVADWRGSGAKGREKDEASYEARYSGVLDIPVDRSISPEVLFWHTVKAASWIMAFACGIWILGFLISIPLFIFSYLIYEAQAGRAVALVIAGLTFSFIWVVFEVMIHLAWPEAALFTLLGY